MVRDFHRIIGVEARQQVLDLVGRLPDVVCACVGGGSNAMGIFHRFIDDASVRLVGFEAGGEGVESGKHAARFSAGFPGVLHGAYTYVMQDDDGQTIESHSVSAGLDYPSVGPEHAYLLESGRAEYRPITDDEAMEAFSLLSRTEGILPAIESAHALAGAMKLGRELGPDAVILVNLSGRGDKDVQTAAQWFGLIDDEGRVADGSLPDDPGAKGMGEQDPFSTRAARRVARHSSATCRSAFRPSRAPSRR
jgi:tryptophan synthase beta chain